MKSAQYEREISNSYCAIFILGVNYESYHLRHAERGRKKGFLSDDLQKTSWIERKVILSIDRRSVNENALFRKGKMHYFVALAEKRTATQ